MHLDGGCHHGRISNIRGTAYDDLVAINANDGRCAAFEGDITDIDIDGLYSEYCHSAVRLLSTGAKIRRINISNVHGNYYRYAVGFTHFFGDRPTRGTFDAITISNCHVAKCLQPADLHMLAAFPLFYFDGRIDVGTVTIRDVTREESTSNEATIGIVKSCHVGRLILRDISQVNRTDESLTFLQMSGRVDELVRENIRLVDAPGANVPCDEKKAVDPAR